MKKGRTAMRALVAAVLVGCIGCASKAQTGIDGAAAAVGNLFASFTTQSSLTTPQGKSLDSSQEICNNLDRAPGRVLMFAQGEADTYGSASASFTAVETDFCEDSSGNVQTGTASDGDPLFASFTLFGSVVGDCTENGTTSTLTMTRGSGIVRNRDSYFPEIYGKFEIDGELVGCTLRMNEDGSLDSANSSCTDSSGQSVVLSSGLSCTLDAPLDRLSVPETIEGHYGVTTEEGMNVGYNCWRLYPLVLDSSDFTTITSNCSLFEDYGFNLEGFNVGLVVGGNSSSWTIYETIDLGDLANQIKVMHNEGYPVMGAIDMLYVPSFNGSNWEVIQDGADFPTALIDNADFQDDVTEKILSVSEYVEALHVEQLCPLSEPDRVFNQSAVTNAASTYLQAIRSDIESRFSGDLVWIGQFFNSTDTSAYNLSGFDYAGVNISPQPDMNPSGFVTHVRTQLGNMRSVANSFGIPYLITNAGIWGEALTSLVYDWDADSSRVLDAFQTMKDESDSYGTAGIIFWEGATGEVVFEEYSDLSRYMASEFGGNPLRL